MRNGEAAAKANQNRELLLVAVAAAVAVTHVGAALGMKEHQAFGTQLENTVPRGPTVCSARTKSAEAT